MPKRVLQGVVVSNKGDKTVVNLTITDEYPYAQAIVTIS